MKKYFKILFLILLLPIVISAQTDSVNINEYSEIESVNAGDIIPQLLGGTAIGALTTIPAMGLVAGIAKLSGYEGGDRASLGIAVVGFVVGYTVGNALGVYIVANKNKYDKNYFTLLLSSSVAMATGLLILSASNTAETCFLCYAPLYLPPIMTVAALNIFSRKDNTIEMGVGINKIPNTNKTYCALQVKYNF